MPDRGGLSDEGLAPFESRQEYEDYLRRSVEVQKALIEYLSLSREQLARLAAKYPPPDWWFEIDEERPWEGRFRIGVPGWL